MRDITQTRNRGGTESRRHGVAKEQRPKSLEARMRVRSKACYCEGVVTWISVVPDARRLEDVGAGRCRCTRSWRCKVGKMRKRRVAEVQSQESTCSRKIQRCRDRTARVCGDTVAQNPQSVQLRIHRVTKTAGREGLLPEAVKSGAAIS